MCERNLCSEVLSVVPKEPAQFFSSGIPVVYNGSCPAYIYGKDGLILMTDGTQSRDTRRARWIRTTLLVLALLTSPFLCCGGIQLLDALPSSWLPGSLSFVVNLFESDARVENKTSQTLYLTICSAAWRFGSDCCFCPIQTWQNAPRTLLAQPSPLQLGLCGSFPL